VEPVGENTPLNEVLSRVAHATVPVPVTNGGGKYLGSVSQSFLLQTLDRTG